MRKPNSHLIPAACLAWLTAFAALPLGGCLQIYGQRAPLSATVGIAAASASPLPSPQTPDHLRLGTGDGQTAPIHTALGQDLTVVVRDVDGQPIAGVPVLFQTTQGDAQVTPAIAISGLRGIARAKVQTGIAHVRSRIVASGGATPFPARAAGEHASVAFSVDASSANGGTFGVPTETADPQVPMQYVTADFDGDGNTDFAAIDGNTGQTLLVYLGRGDGTFAAPVVTSLAPAGLSVIGAADLDGDGIPDLVAQGGLLGKYWVLRGHGDGTFDVGPPVATASVNPQSIQFFDFNRDGHPDLVWVDQYLGIFIALGNGDGTFAAETRYSAGGTGNSVDFAVQDIDGDGKLDVVVANMGSGPFGVSDVAVLLGDGDGTLRLIQNIASHAGGAPTLVRLADFDGDGTLDLLVGNNGNFFTLRPGHGDGTFGAPADFTVGGWQNTLVTGDFNGDGNLDVAVGVPMAGKMKIFYGDGQGSFGASPTSVSFSSMPWSFQILGDFNGDGRLDFLVPLLDTGSFGISLGL